jgi:hypothetical protein
MTALAGINFWNCVTKGTASAHGRAYHRLGTPGAFWVSAICSAVAVLMGLALAIVAVCGLLGFI